MGMPASARTHGPEFDSDHSACGVPQQLWDGEGRDFFPTVEVQHLRGRSRLNAGTLSGRPTPRT